MKKAIIIIFAVAIAHILLLSFLGQSFAEEGFYYVNIFAAIIGAVGLLLCFIFSIIKRKEINKTKILLLLFIFSTITLCCRIAWENSYFFEFGAIEKLCGVPIQIGLCVLAVIPPYGFEKVKWYHKALFITLAVSAAVLLTMLVIEMLFNAVYLTIPMHRLYVYIAEVVTVLASAVLFVSHKKNKQ